VPFACADLVEVSLWCGAVWWWVGVCVVSERAGDVRGDVWSVGAAGSLH
jgi:hypothetical protein